jgi:hypothetical protein
VFISDKKEKKRNTEIKINGLVIKLTCHLAVEVSFKSTTERSTFLIEIKMKEE